MTEILAKKMYCQKCKKEIIQGKYYEHTHRAPGRSIVREIRNKVDKDSATYEDEKE